MPFNWRLPTEEEAAELYRRIDQLIADLYNLIRSILIGPPARPPRDQILDETGDGGSVPDLLAHLGSGQPPTTNSKDENNQPPMR